MNWGINVLRDVAKDGYHEEEKGNNKGGGLSEERDDRVERGVMDKVFLKVAFYFMYFIHKCIL